MTEIDKLNEFIEQQPKSKYTFDGKLERDKVEVCRDENDCIELAIQSTKMIDMMNVGWLSRRLHYTNQSTEIKHVLCTPTRTFKYSN